MCKGYDLLLLVMEWGNVNKVTCQTFCRKSGFRTRYESYFHKTVTYLLHGGAVGVRIKRCKRVKIGQTIRFGSDDF